MIREGNFFISALFSVLLLSILYSEVNQIKASWYADCETSDGDTYSSGRDQRNFYSDPPDILAGLSNIDFPEDAFIVRIGASQISEKSFQANRPLFLLFCNLRIHFT